MRVADRMLTNNMLTNINRSLLLLDKYSTQGSSGKKIQNPSDNPIIASRALRYRTIVSETEQYLENVSQANAWVQVTESALGNINSIIQNMRELCVQGASDTYTTEDRAKIITEFNSLLEQLETEFNTTYMGRHIFSGFCTNMSPIIKDDNGNNVLNPEIFSLKAGYTSSEFTVSNANAGNAGAGGNVNTADANTSVKITYTDETGTTQTIDVTVDLSTITDDGESNGTDVATLIAEELNKDTAFSDVFTATVQNGKFSFFANETGNIQDIKVEITDASNIVTFVEGTSTNGSDATIEGQNINVAVGTSTTITVNSLIGNIYNQDDYLSLHALDDIYATITSEEYANLSEEEKLAKDAELDIRASLENMISSLDAYAARMSIEHTKVGVSINKLELIETRLTDDRINYKTLQSENEDIDLAEVSMNYNAASAAYTAALKIGMTINQMTLADYL